MSGRSVSDHLNKTLYEVSYFLITKNGEWYQVPHYPDGDLTQSVAMGGNFQALDDCDILLPILHGTYGEDGTMQGFFEILGKAYVGCDHRSSAICMDKSITKLLCKQQGINTPEFVSFTQAEWKASRQNLCEKIIEKLTFPVFVKANHLGSSVGLYKVQSNEELEEKVDEAFKFDTKVLVEQGIVGREIEFAVYGNDNPYAFPPGEVLTSGKVYDYEAKYGENGFKTLAKASMPERLVDEGRKLAVDCYRYVGCQGLTRVDFFLDEKGTFWLNEMNPIPGFTHISLYPSICQANGLKYASLLDKLIILGLEKHRKNHPVKNAKIYNFQSQAVHQT